MSKIIAICNRKGGVGKTTTSINLSAALAHYSKKVLLVDMDPQGNTSQGLGYDISLLDKCVFDLLNNNEKINKVIKHTKVENLDILPSKLKLATLDNLSSDKDPNFVSLKLCLDKVKQNYDFVIIDCPHSFGYLTFNALVAANTVLIPVQCEYFAMSAITQILSSISQVQNKLNPTLSIEGFLLTMYDSKANHDIEISSEVRSLFKEKTFLSQIPRNISIPESNMRGEPVTTYRPNSFGAIAYFSLAKEIMDND